MKISKALASGVALLALATVSCAEDQKAQQPLPEALQSLTADGVEIVETFAAPGGLTGYIGRYNGQPIEIYLTEDKKHVVVGALLDSSGNRYAQDYLAAASGTGLDWNSLAQTHWVAEGDPDAANIVYVFTDPNCPYCAMFWEKSQPYLERGGVQVRHIMVGMLRPDSLPKAATILAADDPAAMLAQHEQTMKKGGIKVDKNIPEEVFQQVRDNTHFMQSNGINATPAVVFKDANGKVQQIQGIPSSQLMEQHIFRNTGA
jgi:thiol:disulfide interchange protein DsbG